MNQMTDMTMLVSSSSRNGSSNGSSRGSTWLAEASFLSFFGTGCVDLAWAGQQVTANAARLMEVKKVLELKACTPNQDNSALFEPSESQV